VNGGQCCA